MGTFTWGDGDRLTIETDTPGLEVLLDTACGHPGGQQAVKNAGARRLIGHRAIVQRESAAAASRRLIVTVNTRHVHPTASVPPFRRRVTRPCRSG
jgi:hypothetical protein